MVSGSGIAAGGRACSLLARIPLSGVIGASALRDNSCSNPTTSGSSGLARIVSAWNGEFRTVILGFVAYFLLAGRPAPRARLAHRTGARPLSEPDLNSGPLEKGSRGLSRPFCRSVQGANLYAMMLMELHGQLRYQRAVSPFGREVWLKGGRAGDIGLIAGRPGGHLRGSSAAAIGFDRDTSYGRSGLERRWGYMRSPATRCPQACFAAPVAAGKRFPLTGSHLTLAAIGALRSLH